jgi:prefoldin beta subunit
MDQAQLEKMTREYQMLQERLQSLTMQKDQFSVQKEEYKEAFEELEKSSGKVYLAVGGVIIEVTKDKAVEDLKEKRELTDTRLNIITKQLDEATQKEKTLREQITASLKEMK